MPGIQEENDMFRITPMDSLENNIDEEAEISNFKKQAIEAGYTENIVQAAGEKAKERNCNSYSEFEDLIDDLIKDAESENYKKNKRQERVKKSIELEISRLSSMDNIAQYADSCIYNTYNTRSVTIADILYSSSEKDLNLELYQEPIYSIVLQINKEWVSEIVQKVMSAWQDKEYPKKFVEDYLKQQGVSDNMLEEKKKELITYLSSDYMNDVAPDEFKQFKAVQQLLKQSGSTEGDFLLKNREIMREYSATMGVDMDEGVPVEASASDATESAVMRVSGKVGEICGKAIALKYKTAKNFEDMMCETMGEYEDAYKEDREIIKERKEKIKSQRAEIKLEKARIKSEEKIELNRQKLEARTDYEDRYVRDYEMRNRDIDRVSMQNRDSFLVRHMTEIIFVLVCIFISLICWFVMNRFCSFLAIGGIICSLVGMLKFKNKVKNRDTYTTMICGVLLFILSIYLTMK